MSARPEAFFGSRGPARAVLAVLPLAVVLLAAIARAVSAGDLEKARDTARAVEEKVRGVIERTGPAFLVVSGGSGIVIDPQGFALTNHHVIAGRSPGDHCWVRRAGKGPVRAAVVGQDPRGDIALLKLEGPGPHPFAPLGDSESLSVGELVIALGNPYAFGRDATPAASLGIVSALHTYRHAYSDAIQTDAAVNPGNSGGPLVNLRGEVVGINGRVAVRFGNRMNTGVAYAIPAEQIRRFLPLLKRGGVVPHGHIAGLFTSEVPEGGEGALVARVDPGSAAARAGLRAGDRIVGAGGRSVTGPAGLHGIIGTFPAGEEVALRIRRGETEIEARVVLLPLEQGSSGGPRAYLGLRLGGAPEDGPGGTEGVVIEEVEPGSPAHRAGVRAGDLLTRFDGAAVRLPDEIRALLGLREPGATVELEIRRGKDEIVIEVTLGRGPEKMPR